VSGEKPEEETYSLIYTSLKHPIRRRILRMLMDKHLTFSEILEAVGIDSGHLNYHLDNLGDLITRSQEGKYQLSSIGSAAVKLMGGVEEHSLELSKSKLKPSRIFAKIYPLLLCGLLILASLYFINYTTTVTRVTNGVGWLNVLPNANMTAINQTTNSVTATNLTVIYSSPVNFTYFSAPGNVNESFIVWTEKVTPLNVTTSWEQLEKPYFSYGVAGLVIALVYPAVVLIEPLRNLRHKPKPQNVL
jgi:DNA-binding transcriptional ArsR family regulator